MKTKEPIFKDLSKRKPSLKNASKQKLKTQKSRFKIMSFNLKLQNKKTFVSLETLKFGVYKAVSSFNDGHFAVSVQ